MIEVKDVKEVKNVDKDIKNVSKKPNYIAASSLLLGYSMGGLILTFLVWASKVAISLELATAFRAFTQVIFGVIAGTAVFCGIDKIRCEHSKRKLNRLSRKIKSQTGVELELEGIEKSIERVEKKTTTITDKENSNDITEDEIIKRFYMLDKSDQLQVLEFSKKVVLDSLGKTENQTLHVYEEEDKKDIDFIEEKKELKFIPVKKPEKENNRVLSLLKRKKSDK